MQQYLNQTENELKLRNYSIRTRKSYLFCLKEYFNFKKEDFTFDQINKYGYFGKDYESYMRSAIDKYSEAEALLFSDKVIKAKILSEEHPEYLPQFIEDIAKSLFLVKEKSGKNKKKDEINLEEVPEEVPF